MSLQEIEHSASVDELRKILVDLNVTNELLTLENRFLLKYGNEIRANRKQSKQLQIEDLRTEEKIFVVEITCFDLENEINRFALF